MCQAGRGGRHQERRSEGDRSSQGVGQQGSAGCLSCRCLTRRRVKYDAGLQSCSLNVAASPAAGSQRGPGWPQRLPQRAGPRKGPSAGASHPVRRTRWSGRWTPAGIWSRDPRLWGKHRTGEREVSDREWTASTACDMQPDHARCMHHGLHGRQKGISERNAPGLGPTPKFQSRSLTLASTGF